MAVASLRGIEAALFGVNLSSWEIGFAALPLGLLLLLAGCWMFPYRALRVAFNSALLLTHFGQVTRPENPSLHSRLLGYVKKAKKRGESTAAALLNVHLEPHVVDFEHTVVLYNRSAGHTEPGEPTGRTTGFKVVRGHMRMQAHGPKSVLRKLIYVKPYFVHPELAAGMTSINYEVRG